VVVLAGQVAEEVVVLEVPLRDLRVIVVVTPQLRGTLVERASQVVILVVEEEEDQARLALQLPTHKVETVALQLTIVIELVLQKQGQAVAEVAQNKARQLPV
jgi:hypothetical protein